MAAAGSLCACMRSYRYKFSVFAEKKKIVDILIESPDRHLKSSCPAVAVAAAGPPAAAVAAGEAARSEHLGHPARHCRGQMDIHYLAAAVVVDLNTPGQRCQQWRSECCSGTPWPGPEWRVQSRQVHRHQLRCHLGRPSR